MRFSGSRRRHGARLSGTVLLSTGLLLAAAPGWSVEDSAATHPGTSVSAELTAPATSARSTVTLITGDRVEVRALPDGRQLASLLPRPDGTRSIVKSVEDDGDVYVIPAEAEPFLAAGSLDRELFNVTTLTDVASFRGDEALPLIVTYPDDSAPRTLAQRAAPEHSTTEATLESVDALAVAVEAAEARDFWTDLSDDLAGDPNDELTAQGTGIRTVWLDAVVDAGLAESAPQVAAPSAWDAGFTGEGVKVAILDTGIDTTHPDLAGKVVAEANFTENPTAADGRGHGTHVAATVAGTGAASGGARKGIAYEAQLLNGKVLNDAGSGALSQVIDGMEWAVANDADIVNLSLGVRGSYTDGTDPASQAVDRLSAESDALFVIAAGNDGPGDRTVTTPGAANSALTVGAVDRDDDVASFSSRGPRAGDYALKPDLTAPGVGIVAARATGTSMGTPVDGLHTAASGTSMATPHVAGGAALLAQQHPEWDGEQLKDALMSSSTPLSANTVYEVGAGRLDLGRAVTGQVQSRPGSVSFGSVPYTEDPVPPVTRTITYANVAADDLELDLSVEVTDGTGAAAPDGMFALAARHVTVPGGGTASVEVTFDPNVGAPGVFGGHVTAADASGEIVLHTAVGASKEQKLIEVVVEGITQNGQAAGRSSQVELWNHESDAWETGFFAGKGGAPQPAVFHVPAGTYSVLGFLWNLDASGLYGRELAMVSRPEVTIEQDTRIVLDGTGGRLMDPVTPRPTELRELTLNYHRTSERHAFDLHYLMDRYVPAVYITETAPVSTGEFEVSSHWELHTPEFTMWASEDRAAALESDYAINSPRVDGQVHYDVVDAGRARPDDLTGVDLDGKLALIEWQDDVGVDGAVQAVADAGAVAAVVYYDRPGWFLGWVPEGSPIPSFTVSQDLGQRLRTELAESGRLNIDVHGTPDSPYVYDLFPRFEGRVPADFDRAVDHRDLAREDARYVGSGAAQLGAEIRFPFRPFDTVAIRKEIPVAVPSARTEWITPGEITWHALAWADRADRDSVLVDTRRRYEAGQRSPAEWFAAVARPGVPSDTDHYGPYGMPGFRQNDEFTIFIRSILDGGGHYNEDLMSAARFYRDGELVAEGTGVYGVLPASPDPARYRLELDVDRSEPWWRHSTQTRTAWEFDSARPDSGDPERLGLLQVDHDVDTDLNGRVAAGAPTPLEILVHRQAETDAVRGATVALSVSYDRGATWAVVSDLAGTDGSFSASLKHPRGAESVSLRIRATAPDGNVLEQTVIDAFGIAGR